MVVTSVPSESDENTVIPELLIPGNAHNRRKYWIAIKTNLFRGRACFSWLSPPKATSIQWGSNVVNLNGITQDITLPLKITYAAAAVVTMRSRDFPGYVACPYWSECTQTSIKITPDYEIGQGYAGTAQAPVTWILLSF